ncbi:hypothetical protein M0R72_08290 [Candidatus Pacearchaeota archaeon]|jgi:hypothetical protein|nr:hypothetical protein [Candidatus Pacearchaeota archaeon]
MTFDMRDAREIAEKCNSKDESVDHDYWNAHAGMVLQSALDEIDRLQDRERQLLLDVDRNYRGKKEYANEVERLQRDAHQNNEYIQRCNEMMHTDQKRIAELEAITGVEITNHNLSLIRSILCGNPHTREQRVRAFNLSGKVFRRMQKQRAALKKLGEAKRARGKALAEERAHRYLNLERNADIVAWELDEVSENEQKRLRYNAREQLRQEGKI